MNLSGSRIFSFGLLFTLCLSLSAETQRVTMPDGRVAELFDDGTWRYVEKQEEAPSVDAPEFKKPTDATVQVSTDPEVYQVAYNKKIWNASQKNVNEDAKMILRHKDGDVYVMAVYERVEIEPDALVEVAIQNAQKAASEDIVKTAEGTRRVNGHLVKFVQFDAKVSGMKLRYYAYYASGEWGSLQLITFTSRSLFSKYEKDLTNLLNGLVIAQPKPDNK